VRHYLTPIHPGRTLTQLARFDALLLARVLGAYHSMAASGGPPSSAQPCGFVVSSAVGSAAYVRGRFEQALAGPQASADAPLRAALQRLHDRAAFMSTDAERRPRLEALPPTWAHRDFNFQNVMWAEGGAAEGGVAQAGVIDLVDGVWGSRLPDFVEVLLCMDALQPPQDREAYAAIFEAYLAGGGARFTAEEAYLLPNVLELARMGAAEYWLARDRGAFLRCAEQAGALDAARHVMRAAALQFVEEA
jgi:Ser/Thr protein kinase RdoA (MazF antagonist)